MQEEEKKPIGERDEALLARIEQEEKRARYEDLMVRTQRMKKRMIVISLSALALVAVLFGVLVVAEYAKMKEAAEPPVYEYTFSPTYDRPFTENAFYMALDRKIYYCNDVGGNGLTQELTEGASDRAQAFLYLYMQVLQGGNAEVYNALFNANYFANHQPQAAFSPQMIYDTQIRYHSTTAAENGDMIQAYLLDYKIYENDGTLRRDIGSDMSRTQYIALRVPQSGAVTIEELYVIYPENAEAAEPSTALIVSLIAVPVLLIGGAVAVLIVYRKKGSVVKVEK